MKGASRSSLSQPLAALAPKTASGGKIRARRFVPAWSSNKPLYRFGKTRHRSQTRVGARILANTIGNLVADGIASASEERAMRRAGVERSAAAFDEKFGVTAEVAAYREAGLAAAKHPGSREARANFDRAARAMLEANSGEADVAAFLNHVDPASPTAQMGEIAVTGSRDFLLGSTLDNAGICVGEQGNAIKQGVGQFIQDHPGVGTALTLADGAFAVVAPGKYLAGMALDYFKDEASGYIAGKMTGPQMWSAEKGQAGGLGFVLAGSIALGGLGALKGGFSAIPRGFANLEEFAQFGKSLRGGLSEAGYADANAILQGSAVTGKSFRTGAPFDVGRVSDFDVALSGDSLFQTAKSAGIGLRSNGTRTGPLTARDLKVLGLRDLSLQMSAQAGRPVIFMIYRTTESALQRAPSIILPH